MAKNKHLTLDDRIKIQSSLDKGESFREIGDSLGKDPTTISKEVRGHYVFKKTGAYGRPYNSCALRLSCDRRAVCGSCTSSRRNSFCRFCRECNSHCPDYVKDECPLLVKPPYVCNGCESLQKCTLEKHFYQGASADKEYRDTLSESRQGISLSEAEVARLDGIVSPLIRKGQSLNHICASNADTIIVSERTLYRLVDYGLIEARNIDLPRKVRFSKRKSKRQAKVDKACRSGRDHSAFRKYVAEHPDSSIVELDSVEGKKGGKVLLTIHFVKAEFMLAYIRDANDSRSVTDVFNRLHDALGGRVFHSMFRVLLADNGSEFSDPSAIELDAGQTRRANVFYCDAGRPDQKGSAERNHELIRCFIPKGVDMSPLSQGDVSTMMNHINSYFRESLGNKCPYEVMAFLYGEDVLKKLGCVRIPPNDVTLNATVFEARLP